MTPSDCEHQQTNRPWWLLFMPAQYQSMRILPQPNYVRPAIAWCETLCIKRGLAGMQLWAFQEICPPRLSLLKAPMPPLLLVSFGETQGSISLALGRGLSSPTYSQAAQLASPIPQTDTAAKTPRLQCLLTFSVFPAWSFLSVLFHFFTQFGT